MPGQDLMQVTKTGGLKSMFRLAFNGLNTKAHGRLLLTAFGGEGDIGAAIVTKQEPGRGEGQPPDTYLFKGWHILNLQVAIEVDTPQSQSERGILRNIQAGQLIASTN